MPRGNFIPFDPTELSPRFFARIQSIDLECPICGRLLQIGHGKPDDKRLNRVTSVIRCYGDREGNKSVYGHQFLLGVVAWPLTGGHHRQGRSPDQRPDARQLAKIREYGKGIWAKQKRRKGDNLNQIEPEKDLEEIMGEASTRARGKGSDG